MEKLELYTVGFIVGLGFWSAFGLIHLANDFFRILILGK
jgi:hypothetical protein